VSGPRLIDVSGPRIIDVVLDRLCAGEDVRFIVIQPDEAPCRFPQHKPLTAYSKGCRCCRCRIEHNARAAVHGQEYRRRRAAQRAALRRIQWERRR
jgi:hypothetical protein